MKYKILVTLFLIPFFSNGDKGDNRALLPHYRNDVRRGDDGLLRRNVPKIIKAVGVAAIGGLAISTVYSISGTDYCCAPRMEGSYRFVSPQMAASLPGAFCGRYYRSGINGAVLDAAESSCGWIVMGAAIASGVAATTLIAGTVPAFVGTVAGSIIGASAGINQGPSYAHDAQYVCGYLDTGSLDPVKEVKK